MSRLTGRVPALYTSAYLTAQRKGRHFSVLGERLALHVGLIISRPSSRRVLWRSVNVPYLSHGLSRQLRQVIFASAALRYQNNSFVAKEIASVLK